MAIRPVVLVYQDLATPTVTPTTPDLNCLVVGPAYHIEDYFKPETTDYADKADIKVAPSYGVLEGDPSAATPVGPAYITIAEPPNNTVGAALDGASIQIYVDNARVIIQTGTSATGVTTAALTPNTITGPGGSAWLTGNTKVIPGDRITIKDGTVNSITRTVSTVASDTTLTVTSDVTGGAFVPGASQTYRIERRINDTLIDPSYVSYTNNSVRIAGGVTLPVPNQGNHIVSYADVYEAYRSIRQDLVDLDTIGSQADILSKIGRIDARNPLAVGAFVALQNTTSVVQYIGVLTDDLAGHVTVRDHLSARPDVYAVVPLTTDVSIFAMWNADCVGLALPDNVRGRPQRFRVVLGNGVLPVTKIIAQPSLTGQSVVIAGTAPTALTKIVLSGVASLITSGVVPGDQLHVTVTSNVADVVTGFYPIASVTSATTLKVNTATPFAGAGTLNITAEIVQADGVTVRVASSALTGVITSVGDDLYLQLTDPSATYIASGVAVGDLIKVPLDPNAAITAASVFRTFVVASILSDQRLQIVNNGQDSSLVVNELPHGVKRIGGALVGLTAVSYQVVRSLSKSQQVTELIALAQSFNSKRTTLVWPDKVNVAGVTGGTKQPGYYAACAVGGMTAGLPSQQGFTNLGIAGISQIFDSNTYFTDAQLTDLSNGGWYVFAQQTTSSLPYTIHQLTTNPSTLESGEFSVVKNFDFVSLFFVDILEDFLGQYNVTPDTLTLLTGALNTGGDLLRLRTIAKIGAPLTTFSISDIGVSPTSGDRIITHIAIGLPKPLNVIELHLVG